MRNLARLRTLEKAVAAACPCRGAGRTVVIVTGAAVDTPARSCSVCRRKIETVLLLDPYTVEGPGQQASQGGAS